MNAVLEEKNDLPNGWKLKPIGEIVQPARPRISPSEKPELPFLGMDHIEAHTMRMLGSVPASTMKSSAVHFQPGDVLYGRLRPYLNKVFQPHFEGLCSAEFIVFHETDELDNKYLQYFLNSSTFVRHAISLNSGDRPRVKFEQLAPYEIPLPPTVDQQKRIVAKIEELFSHIDAGIEALKKAKQLLKQYRQSVLKAAVTGELTKEWRDAQGRASVVGGRTPGATEAKYELAQELLERILKERRQKWEEQQLEQFKAKGKMPKDDKWKAKYKEPVASRDWSFLSEIPDSWLWVSVDQIGDSQDQPVLTGPFGSNLGKGDFTQDGVPVLTIGCLQEEGIDLSRAMHVSKKKAEELDRYQLNEGDILFSRMAAVGRAGFVIPELEGALFNYHIMRLRLHPHAMLQEYFVHYVRGSSQVYDYVKEVNHGATRDGINTHQLLEMPVAFAPLQEQKEICKDVGEKLGAIRRLESEIDIQLLKAEKNKQSVLTAAFNGELVKRLC